MCAEQCHRRNPEVAPGAGAQHAFFYARQLCLVHERPLCGKTAHQTAMNFGKGRKERARSEHDAYNSAKQ